jgi:ABC-type nickel/cobalt efflux system permease component RcnA
LAVINRGVGIVQCGLLVFLMCFSRLLGLSWRGIAFGIALGIGVLSSVDIAVFAIRAQGNGEEWTQALNLLTTGSYLICSLIWLGYILAPERKTSAVTNVSGDEVDSWNRELQRWLGS